MDMKKNNAQNMYNSRKASDCNPNLGLKPMKTVNIANSLKSKPAKRLCNSRGCK